MAHENLRFRINLNDYSDYQPILASQDYGTFYLIYIRITSHQKIKVDGIEKHKYMCDFKLQNFRGAITMGFIDDNEDEERTFDLGPSRSNDRIRYGDHELIVKVAPFRLSSEIFQEPLIVDKPLSRGDIIRTKLSRLKPPKDLYLSEEPEKSRYLNPYRFQRDGDEFQEIGMRVFGSEDPFKDPSDGGLPGGICIPELSLIV